MPLGKLCAGEGNVHRLEDLFRASDHSDHSQFALLLSEERLERAEMFQADSQSLWQAVSTARCFVPLRMPLSSLGDSKVQSLNIKTLREELRSAPWCRPCQLYNLGDEMPCRAHLALLVRAISDLECELKALLAGQVEVRMNQ